MIHSNGSLNFYEECCGSGPGYMMRIRTLALSSCLPSPQDTERTECSDTAQCSVPPFLVFQMLCLVFGLARASTPAYPVWYSAPFWLVFFPPLASVYQVFGPAQASTVF